MRASQDSNVFKRWRDQGSCDIQVKVGGGGFVDDSIFRLTATRPASAIDTAVNREMISDDEERRASIELMNRR